MGWSVHGCQPLQALLAAGHEHDHETDEGTSQQDFIVLFHPAGGAVDGWDLPAKNPCKQSQSDTSLNNSTLCFATQNNLPSLFIVHECPQLDEGNKSSADRSGARPHLDQTGLTCIRYMQVSGRVHVCNIHVLIMCPCSLHPLTRRIPDLCAVQQEMVDCLSLRRGKTAGFPQLGLAPVPACVCIQVCISTLRTKMWCIRSQSVFTCLQVLEIIKKQSSSLYEEVMAIASDVFNTLLERAVKLQRNYILDQAK